MMSTRAKQKESDPAASMFMNHSILDWKNNNERRRLLMKQVKHESQTINNEMKIILKLLRNLKDTR